jgi:CRP/FNR family transcriptional regulator/CRP/FNR family cyclic AMP-dependent transcriptional regulator
MASADPPRLSPGDEDALVVARALRLEGFFPEFTGEQCCRIFPRSGVAQYAAGDYLIEQDESGRDLFVIVEGAVSVTQNMGSAAAELAKLGPGALMGEMGLLGEGLRKASAIAAVPTRAFRFVYGDMAYVIANNPLLATHLECLAKERS